jgi:uncharacterized protein DUF6263
MSLSPYLFCIILFLFQGCHRDPANDNFYFRPDSFKIYSITLNKQETSGWKYNNKDQVATTSEKINFSLKLICTVDSLYQLKLTFGDIRVTHRPMRITIGRITKTCALDSIPSTETIENNFYQFNYYLLGFTKGLSLYIWMNKKGEVVQVKGFDNLADSVAVLSGGNKKDVKYALTDDAGEKTISDYLNQLFSIAPDHKENAGDSWVRNIILNNKAPVKLNNMYSINKIDGDSLFVHVTSSISGWAGANAARPFMEGQGEGEITISRLSGVTYSCGLNSMTNTKTDSYVINRTENFSATVR